MDHASSEVVLFAMVSGQAVGGAAGRALRPPAREGRPLAMHASDEDLELDFPSKDPGQMRTFSPVSRVKIQIQIIDISRSGLKVRTPQLVFRGTIVQVRVREAIILGEVRYCVAAGTEFDAGIQIQDVVPMHKEQPSN